MSTEDRGISARRPASGPHRSFPVTPSVLIVMGFAAAVVAGQFFYPDDDGGGRRGIAEQAEMFGQAQPADDRKAVVVEAEKLLAQRADAVLAGTVDDWVSPLNSLDTELVAEQRVVFEQLSSVPIASWEYAINDAGMMPLSAEKTDQLTADEGWQLPVVLSYELADSSGAPLVGHHPVQRQRQVTLVRRGDQWLLTDVGSAAAVKDIWEVSDVVVVEADRAVVLGAGSEKFLRSVANRVADAADRADAVWGDDWPRKTVVIVPETQADMAALLGRESAAGLDQVAAVTTGAVDRSGLQSSSTGDRVIVNPKGYEELQRLGRTIVLTHELTHVATRASGSTEVPMWLSEGFADYVAYSSHNVSKAAIARPAVAAFKDGTLGASLPSKKSFDPGQGDIAPAYSGSWVALDILVKRHGQEHVTNFYRMLSEQQDVSGNAVDELMRAELGIDTAELTVLWRGELQRRAGR